MTCISFALQAADASKTFCRESNQHVSQKMTEEKANGNVLKKRPVLSINAQSWDSLTNISLEGTRMNCGL
jgi:hypothetical protein